MKYFIVAGEKSGDLHGANLMQSILKLDKDAVFQFCGGDAMEKVSKNTVLHINEMSFMGFAEVVMNLGKILSNFKKVKTAMNSFKPDAVVLIDYPGFNLKLAKFAKENQWKVHYYISPKVWAWKESRIKKIKAFVDHLYCILPFEVAFFKKHGLEIDYVGNPILDEIDQFKSSHSIDTKEENTIALLPGSRVMEIQKILPPMVEAAKQFPDKKIIVSAISNLPKSLYSVAENAGFELAFDQSYHILARAQSALVTSGTATLETALFNVPQVVCYRANPITIWIARRFVKIKYISLVNLILDTGAVRELIQEECNPETIKYELANIIEGEHRSTLLANYNDLHQKMGKPGASDNVAKLIYERIS